jgi:hypothetical protein
MFDLATIQKRMMHDTWKQIVDRVPATPWTEDFKLPKRTNVVFDAKTWTPFRLFEVPPTPGNLWNGSADNGLTVLSPNKRWGYDELVLPKASPLSVCWSGGRTNVAFNDDILIPRIREFHADGRHKELWMSYTPQEVITLRAGLKKAKGSVIVAGLGMGWLLTRVAHKPSVKEVLLVERDEALLDWLWPVIRERYWPSEKTRQKMTYALVDAQEEIPKRTADVALWDIWETLGHVDKYDEDAMALKCPNIGTTWFWGANARIPDSIWG